MEQLMCASLSHTHYWYEVDMLKIPATVVIPFILDVRLVDAPAGVTQEQGRTGFLHLLSAVLDFIFSREKDSAVPFPRRR